MQALSQLSYGPKGERIVWPPGWEAACDGAERTRKHSRFEDGIKQSVGTGVRGPGISGVLGPGKKTARTGPGGIGAS